MADQLPERDSAQHTDAALSGSSAPGPSGPGRTDETARMPRWVKVFGIIAVLVLVLVIVMLLAGHGPGRHA